MTRPGPGAYPRLFSPFTLGRLRLPNRFTVPALTTNYATPDGFVTDALCAYLAARARGGFGLVVTENLGVHPGGRVMPRMAMIDDNRYVPGLARLASAVKREGAVGRRRFRTRTPARGFRRRPTHAESRGPAGEPALAVAGAGARFDDELGDAYEPGRLTETVYEAVARAAALDGPARSTPER
ncbi:MAG: hypothetical protein HYU26_17725 [Candidatus Rokubacteria bacterium]|nr:hypothetical protein [Candidatus Rokubacteria bacterium]